MNNLILSIILGLLLNLTIGIIFINLMIAWVIDDKKWSASKFIFYFVTLIFLWPFYTVVNIFMVVDFCKKESENET